MSKIKNIKLRKTTTKTRKKGIKGGRVIASGGFGCVFDPPLKCQGEQREKNMVSKLMTKQHILSEYNEIKEIKEKLEKIPNYKEYFLVDDISICNPDKLVGEDLKDFEKKCTALPKKNITKDNINKNLDKLMILNMPHGGIPIDDYFVSVTNYKEIIHINDKLIKLLKDGIVPMNKENVYHTDIKESNVLISKDDKLRLIDWGVSVLYIPNTNAKFPSRWKNRSVHFNNPFSLIMFTDDFAEMYSAYLNNKKIKDKKDEKKLREFVKIYFDYWIKLKGPGHLKYINKIFLQLFINDTRKTPTDKYTLKDLKFIESKYTVNYIIDYIVKILVKFTHFDEANPINLRNYLDTVFVEILDIWGFIVCYFPMLEILFENYKKLSETEMKIFTILKHIILKYLYEPRIEPINIDELVSDLKGINDLFGKTNIDFSEQIKTFKNTTSKRESNVTGNTDYIKNNKTRKSRTSML